MKQRYFSGTKWEPLVGYSRAIKADNVIYVSGTTSTDEHGEILFPGDVYNQSVQVIKNIEKALIALGSTLDDIIRTRIYVKDIDKWQDVGRAHHEYFSKARPATSMVEVSRFIHPDIVVEIEAEAFIS